MYLPLVCASRDPEILLETMLGRMYRGTYHWCGPPGIQKSSWRRCWVGCTEVPTIGVCLQGSWDPLGDDVGSDVQRYLPLVCASRDPEILLETMLGRMYRGTYRWCEDPGIRRSSWRRCWVGCTDVPTIGVCLQGSRDPLGDDVGSDVQMYLPLVCASRDPEILLETMLGRMYRCTYHWCVLPGIQRSSWRRCWVGCTGPLTSDFLGSDSRSTCPVWLYPEWKIKQRRSILNYQLSRENKIYNPVEL